MRVYTDESDVGVLSEVFETRLSEVRNISNRLSRCFEYLKLFKGRFPGARAERRTFDGRSHAFVFVFVGSYD